MSIKSKKSKIHSNECRICSVPAEYSYFGVISCHACKMFFKRNAITGQTAFVCDFGGQCEININTRHVCSSCRLTKCFKCGMNIDKLQTSRQTKPKGSISVKKQIQDQLVMLPTLNLLQSDQSLLTTNQWTFLTNLFYCYKESQMLPFIQRLIDTHNASQFTYAIYEVLVDEFLVSVYETAGAYLRSNDDLRHLAFDERSIILRNAANSVCCIGGSFIMQYCHLYGLNTFLTAMNIKYGTRTMDIHIEARKYIDSDIVLIKLSISLFAFCENTYCYHSSNKEDFINAIEIFRIQNKYAEITWKYLLYRYGYHDAVKRFLNIALWLTSMNILAFHAQSLTTHLNDIGSIIEQTEMNLVLDDVEEIIEANQ
ncbi:unnamed protein product [Rotaria sp. Silwood1]|nr:unnamed protein product [Rotaria sp. Silwood1]CAF4959439.1 unnamed protein product [Rotaria sp. Silwood1]